MGRPDCTTTRRGTLTRRLVDTLRAMEKDCWEGSIPTSTCVADPPCWSMLKATLHRFRVQMSSSMTYSTYLRVASWPQQWRGNMRFRKPANLEFPGHTTVLRMRLGTARGLAGWHASRVSIVLGQWASTMKFKTLMMASHRTSSRWIPATMPLGSRKPNVVIQNDRAAIDAGRNSKIANCQGWEGHHYVGHHVESTGDRYVHYRPCGGLLKDSCAPCKWAYRRHG
jgi:hypothetical protein